MVKYVHARLPGREQIHLVPAEGLERDERFGEEAEHVLSGQATALCGKRGSGWIVDTHGLKCLRCAKRR